MTELYAIIIFLFALFLLLGSSVWVGLALMGVAWVGMELFTTRPAGDAMITTIWTGASSWTLTALPFLFGWGKYYFEQDYPKICSEASPPGCGFYQVAYSTQI